MSVVVDVNPMVLQGVVNSLIDDQTMLAIHNTFAKMCDPYVPMLNGPLHESGLAGVTPKYVEYNVPYAHYQYVGQDFNHTVEYHPKATAFWDQVMMQEKGDEFYKEVEAILLRRAKELYG